MNFDYRTFEGDSLELDEHSPFFLDHVTRYWWAAESFAKDRDVLDCACGKGYGAYVLGSRATSVLAIDLNEASLARARSTFARPNLSFQEWDALKLPGLGKKFDLITAFELIEHLPEDSTDLFLEGVARSLKPGGTALISTPNHDVVRASGVAVPEFHINNFRPKRLRTALQKHFKHVQMLGQFRRRSGMRGVLFDWDFLNLRHRVARPLQGHASTEKRGPAQAPRFDQPPPGSTSYAFSPKHWRQAGLTIAVCR